MRLSIFVNYWEFNEVNHNHINNLFISCKLLKGIQIEDANNFLLFAYHFQQNIIQKEHKLYQM